MESIAEGNEVDVEHGTGDAPQQAEQQLVGEDEDGVKDEGKKTQRKKRKKENAKENTGTRTGTGTGKGRKEVDGKPGKKTSKENSNRKRWRGGILLAGFKSVSGRDETDARGNSNADDADIDPDKNRRGRERLMMIMTSLSVFASLYLLALLISYIVMMSSVSTEDARARTESALSFEDLFNTDCILILVILMIWATLGLIFFAALAIMIITSPTESRQRQRREALSFNSKTSDPDMSSSKPPAEQFRSHQQDLALDGETTKNGNVQQPSPREVVSNEHAQGEHLHQNDPEEKRDEPHTQVFSVAESVDKPQGSSHTKQLTQTKQVKAADKRREDEEVAELEEKVDEEEAEEEADEEELEEEEEGRYVSDSEDGGQAHCLAPSLKVVKSIMMLSSFPFFIFFIVASSVTLERETIDEGSTRGCKALNVTETDEADTDEAFIPSQLVITYWTLVVSWIAFLFIVIYGIFFNLKQRCATWQTAAKAAAKVPNATLAQKQHTFRRSLIMENRQISQFSDTKAEGQKQGIHEPSSSPASGTIENV